MATAPAEKRVLPFLYLCSSQFSGSTLSAFILNTHPGVATVGHMTGWKFAADEDFRCSCGEPLQTCPFYNSVSEAFAKHELPFDFRDFGTGYRLHADDRINRLLTGAVLRMQSSAVEGARDRLVNLVPAWKRRIATTNLANVTFTQAALAWGKAEVFLDNSQDPYRLRYLAAIPQLSLRSLHLVRDPRGTSLSMMNHAGWDAELSARQWLRRQTDIARIAAEASDSLLVHYETLCEDTDAELRRIHEFAGLTPHPFDGDFKAGEHHVLGNTMRFRGGEIKLDERWKRELRPEDRRAVERVLNKFRSSRPTHSMSEVIAHYLDS
ncbi:MAG: sulfotransferase [Pseudomonadota bacterium]